MPTIAKHDDRQLETGLRITSQSTTQMQPWWQGYGDNTMSLVSENTVAQGNAEGGNEEKETNAQATESGISHITYYSVIVSSLSFYLHLIYESTASLTSYDNS